VDNTERQFGWVAVILDVTIKAFLVRILLTSRLSWKPFAIGGRLRGVFSRTLEIGIVLHLILIPVVWHSGEFKWWFAQAGAAAEEIGFVVIDPTSRFVEELTLGDLGVNPLDPHPSAACNRIYGEELFRTVEPTVSGSEAH